MSQQEQEQEVTQNETLDSDSHSLNEHYTHTHTSPQDLDYTSFLDDLDDDRPADSVSISELAAAWEQAEQQTAQESEWGVENRLQQYTPQTDPSDRQHTNHRNPFEEGVECFNRGELSRAIDLFEEELSRNPENSDCWLMLGKSHCENDEDTKAIVCLEHAVEHDPYCLEALLTLGVSCVNEMDIERSLKNLKAWVLNNPSFAGIDLQQIASVESSSNNRMFEVELMLRQALKINPGDADVLEVLGVVLNTSKNWSDAVDFLEEALRHKPDNYNLLNKLGATLANSNRSAEAIPHYLRALSLKPKFSRGWLNIAIAHSNLRNFDEACRAYLQALSLNENATHIWSYLRISLTLAERWDLLPLATEQVSERSERALIKTRDFRVCCSVFWTVLP